MAFLNSPATVGLKIEQARSGYAVRIEWTELFKHRSRQSVETSTKIEKSNIVSSMRLSRRFHACISNSLCGSMKNRYKSLPAKKRYRPRRTHVWRNNFIFHFVSKLIEFGNNKGVIWDWLNVNYSSVTKKQGFNVQRFQTLGLGEYGF